MRRTLLASTLLLASSLACFGSDDRINAGGFTTYGEQLCTAASASLTLRRCEMAPPNSRLGYCEAEGAGASAIPTAFALEPASPDATREWSTSFNSGCAEG